MLVSVLFGGMFGSVCGQQKIEMNLPRMEAFPPYGLDIEGGKFVASWKALDTVPLRGLLAYVGISRNADAGGRQYVLETKIKGDPSLVEGAYKAMRRGVYAHDYMTGLGWLVHEGEVSRQGIVLRKKPSLPDEFTPILQSPVFDASHGGGKFTFKFTASAVPAEGQDTVTLCVYHMPNMRGVKPVVVNLALKADGLPHEYAVEFSGGSAEECVYLSPLTTGAVIVLEGEMGVEQVTIMNLDVVKVDAELNMLVVRGAVPGPKGGLVTIRTTKKTIVEKKGEAAGISANPQKASARVNPQKASARNK